MATLAVGALTPRRSGRGRVLLDQAFRAGHPDQARLSPVSPAVAGHSAAPAPGTGLVPGGTLADVAGGKPPSGWCTCTAMPHPPGSPVELPVLGNPAPPPRLGPIAGAVCGTVPAHASRASGGRGPARGMQSGMRIIRRSALAEGPEDGPAARHSPSPSSGVWERVRSLPSYAG